MNHVNDEQDGDVQPETSLGHNSEIGKKLKAFYTAIQDETIPERFLELLNALDRAEEAGQQNKQIKIEKPDNGAELER